MGSGSAVTCRDYAAGRCQRGSECRFLHEDSGRRQSNRYYDSGASDSRESRGERGRYSEQGRENFRDSRERSDYPRDRFFRNDRPTTRCYDFIKGRCRRGSECRYAHHEASYDSGRGDEARERGHDRRDAERRLDPPRRVGNDTPCKFFAEGCCRRGEACKFSHQVVGSHNDRSGYSMGIDVSNSSWNSLTPGDQPAVMCTSGSSQQMGNDIDRQVDDSRYKPQHSQSQVSESNVYQNRPQEASNPLAVASVPEQSFGQGGQNQYIASQPVQAQSITPNVQIQQLFPPGSLNGQMQQAIFSLPQNVQGQFIAQAPSNFNIVMQNLPVVPPSQIAQNQQNYNMPQPHSGQNRQNFNLSGQILQNLPVPLVNGQNEQNQLNINCGGQSHQTLPPPQDGQNQNVAPQPPNPESFNSNEQVMQKTDTSEMQPSNLNSDTPITPKVVTSEQAAQITNLSASLARFFGSGGALNPQIATGLVPLVPPNQGSFSQQQAIPSPGSAEPENPDTNNLPPGFEQKDSALEEASTNIDSSAPLSIIGGACYGNPPTRSVDLEVKVMPATEDAAAKEVNETETVPDKKEQAEDTEADVHRDEENKQSKDAKGMRMFKCALVEFVKDVLKPSWKEGHLSKEAHKTIVKKVVEKVTSAMQSQSIPQTQEKIVIYMSHSKVKLTKLVQVMVACFLSCFSVTIQFKSL